MITAGLLILLIALAADETTDAPLPKYQVGNYVIVIKETAIVVNGSSDKIIPLGTMLAVEEVDGNLLGVTSGRKGWIDSSAVTTPEKAVDIFTEDISTDPENLQLRRARGSNVCYKEIRCGDQRSQRACEIESR